MCFCREPSKRNKKQSVLYFLEFTSGFSSNHNTCIKLPKKYAAIYSTVQYNRSGLFRVCGAFFLCSCKTEWGWERVTGCVFCSQKSFFFFCNPTHTINQFQTKQPLSKHCAHSHTQLRIGAQSFTYTTRILRQRGLCLPPSVLWGLIERRQTRKAVR